MIGSPDAILGSPENDPSSETVAITIAKKLGLGIRYAHRQWGSQGEIYLDFSDGKNSEIEQAILETQLASAALLNEAVTYEAAAVGSLAESEKIGLFDGYLKYLADEGFLQENRIDERAIAALKLGLMSHWNRVKAQIKHGARGIKSWEDFRMDSLNRATRWRTISYADELQEGADLELKYGIALDDLDSQRSYFVTPYMTHTTDSESALLIANSGLIQSDDRNNFSVSSVVVRVARTRGNITFIFEGHDLLRAIPFMHGQSMEMYENEVTTHFPVPMKLARAVIPTNIILNLHQTDKPKSGGTISQKIQPSLLRVS